MTIRSKLFPALLATVTFLALVIAAFGFVSLFTGSDVIPDRSAGTLTGPAMLAVTTGTFFLGLLWLIRMAIAHRGPVAVILAIALGSPLVYCLTGAIVELFATGLLAQSLIFLGVRLVSPYSAAVGGCALLLAIGFQLVSLTPRQRGHV